MSDHSETEEIEEAEYTGPATYTNREILQLIMKEIEEDGDLDEEASVMQILDMGALHHPAFTWAYGTCIQEEVRIMTQQEYRKAAEKESQERGEHLTLVE